MIRFIAGEKGQGKTKKLIGLANESAKTTDGSLVYIDDDKRHIYDLHYAIRFVCTVNFPLSNGGEFIGFVCGILSQDSDIKEIFIDGLTNIVSTIRFADLPELVQKLENLSRQNHVDFIISINAKKSELPSEIQEITD